MFVVVVVVDDALFWLCRGPLTVYANPKLRSHVTYRHCKYVWLSVSCVLQGNTLAVLGPVYFLTVQQCCGFGSGRISYSATVLRRRIPTVQVQQCGGDGSDRISCRTTALQ